MSDADIAKVAVSLPPEPTVVPKQNGKAGNNKNPSKKNRKKREPGDNSRSVSGRIRSIIVKNSGDHISAYHFELISKKAGCRRYALDTTDMGRLSLIGGLLGVAHSTNAKVSVVSTSGSNGLDFVTELEVMTKR